MITRTRSVYLSPDDAVHKAILAAADAATVSLYALIYAFTLPDLATIIAKKHAAGLHTGVVADRSQSVGIKQHALLQGLVDAGVPVTITTAKTGQINHQKILLVDHEKGFSDNDSYSVYGSVNFSELGPLQNNHCQIDNDPTICELFWNQYCAAEIYGKAHVHQIVPTVTTP